MKRLYLVRHAKSSWKDPDLKDFDRPLNKRGKRDAPFMGKQLAKQKIKPDIMLSSPARRAMKTAKIVAKKIDYPVKSILFEDKIYSNSVPELLDIMKQIDKRHESMMIFGHNPALTDMASFLSDKGIDNIPTCGIICMDFDVASWDKISEGKGTLVFFDYPKKYKI